jgi:outer membrane lipoprotein carrier protein
MRGLTVSVLVALATLPALSAQTPQTPDALARALQERYRKIADFTADFVQESRGGPLPATSRAEGTVAVKKPGRMRWNYKKPQRQEIISNGVTVYWYFPDDKEVQRADVPRENEATTSMLFLAGKGDITRDFTASSAQSSVPGTIALKLTPRQTDSEFEYLVVSLDPATLQIRGLTTRDFQGSDNTITFRNLKENTRVSDSVFDFKIPRGVVVTGAQP